MTRNSFERKTIQEYKEIAMRHGALDAQHDLAMNAQGNHRLWEHLNGLHGKYRDNVEAILLNGYNEGYTKAKQYFNNL